MAHADRGFDGEAILGVLAKHAVDYVVVGGIAVQAHGYLRATGDLDIIPEPTALNLSRLAEALADLEADVWRAQRPVDVLDPNLLRRAPLVPLVTRYGRLDLLNIEQTAGVPADYADLAGRAMEIDLGGTALRVAGLDDLIRMKRAAGRDQDLADIGALARVDDELEREVSESS